MGVHADSWIRRMAREHRMIEPFEESLTRKNSGGPVISYGLSSYGYDLRVADEFKVFTNVYNAVVDPKAFDPRSFVDIARPVLSGAAELICPGPQRRVFPHSAGRAHALRRQEHLRTVWHHCECDALGARVGGPCHPGDFQYHSVAGAHLRQRGARASHFSGSDGALRNQLRESRREIPGAARHHGAADVIGRPRAARRIE